MVVAGGWWLVFLGLARRRSLAGGVNERKSEESCAAVDTIYREAGMVEGECMYWIEQGDASDGEGGGGEGRGCKLTGVALRSAGLTQRPSPGRTRARQRSQGRCLPAGLTLQQGAHRQQPVASPF